MKIFAKAFLALLCSLLLWEGFLRIFVVRPVPYHADPVWGWVPVAHSSGMQNIEGYGTMHYNAQGYREDEVSPKPANEIRIVALGDSYTEGRQMAQTQAFPRKLQTLLQNQVSCTGQPIRVFNGGRDGTTPAYSTYLSKPIEDLFQPDWVVFLMRDGAWPEVFNTSKEVFYKENGTNLSFGTSWQGDNMSRSRLRRLITTLHIRDLALYTYAQTKMALLSSKPASEGRTIPDKQEAEKQMARQKRAIDFTLQQIKARFKAKAVVVHFPYGTTAWGGLIPPSVEEQYLAEACRRYGISFIPLRNYIAADLAQTQMPPSGFTNTLPWEGHPNAHGHAIIARALADFFTSRLCRDARKADSAAMPPARQ